jgi:hypothetical protein
MEGRSVAALALATLLDVEALVATPRQTTPGGVMLFLRVVSGTPDAASSRCRPRTTLQVEPWSQTRTGRVFPISARPDAWATFFTVLPRSAPPRSALLVPAGSSRALRPGPRRCELHGGLSMPRGNVSLFRVL